MADSEDRYLRFVQRDFHAARVPWTRGSRPGRPRSVLAVVGGVACIVMSGCGRSGSGNGTGATAATSSVVVAPPASELPAPSAATTTTATPAGSIVAAPDASERHTALATFHENLLDECVDFVVKVRPGESAPDLFKPEKLSDGTLLQKPCEAQFGDRLVLATCSIKNTVNPDGGLPFEVSVLSHYYNFSTVDGDDGYMRDCLKAKGDWQALSKESEEYRHARLRYDAEHLRDLTKRLPQ